ncbi:MAG: c-type cytochrome [Methyloprofundus sp.]|nr:c-type cytochrome [Methyloprofundus sp.]
MKKTLLAVSVSLSLFAMAGNVHAGSIKAGQDKSATCAGCHGEKGNSLVSMYPKLASQNEEYLIKQLHAFKDGSRNGPMMASMASGLSDEDIEDIAVFYEAQKVTRNALPPLELDDDEISDDLTGEQQAELKEKAAADKQVALEEREAMLARGQDVFINGHLESEISACIACHGPEGEGNKPAAFPALNGQHADYLIKTLNDYKAAKRTNSSENIMRMIAQRMSAEEIKAIAYYISTMK